MLYSRKYQNKIIKVRVLLFRTKVGFSVCQNYEITEKYRMESVSFHLKYWLKLTCAIVASTCMLARCTLARSWLRQRRALLNDVVSIIECGQLHSELLGCRHSTLQSHGLFALAKHLLVIVLVKLNSHFCCSRFKILCKT